MNIFSNIVAPISIVISIIGFIISIFAFYFSTRRFLWDNNARTYNFINSIRYWKFDPKDVKSMEDANHSFSDANYVGVNVINSTGYVINECMILFKPKNTMSWKDYCKELIYQGVADYIIYTNQLSPMTDNLHRYVLVSQGIKNMELAMCVKDASGKIWLKPMDGKLMRIKKDTYAKILALETKFSLDIVADNIVARAFNDGQQRLAELDQNFKVL